MSAALDRFFARYYERNPVNATFTGMHEHDHQLPDWTRAGRESEVSEFHELASAALEKHPPPMASWRSSTSGSFRGMQVPLYGGPKWHALVDDPPALDALLSSSFANVRELELESLHFHDRNPALWTGEATFGAVSLMLGTFAPRAARLSPLVARLDAIPGFLADLRTTLAGRVPLRWIERARRECGTAIGLFDRGLNAWLAEEPLDPRAAQRVHDAGGRARAAFADCADWLGGLRVAGEHEYACGALVLGSLVEQGHWSGVPFDLLLQRAMSELEAEQARLRERVLGVVERVEDLPRAIADVHPSASEYLATFGGKWQACRALAAQHDAIQWPDWPIRYVPIPAWARDYAPQLYWLFYRSPAPFDPYTTHDYLVTPIDDSLVPEERERRLRACNHSTITLNHVVHHGAIGHHVQNWHAAHRSRSRIGTIAGVDGASRIGMFLGGTMTEGWACYATELMDELGFLTPLERAAEQQSRVRMLARAIVDVRLHARDLSFSEAVSFYRETTGMSEEAAIAETTKNSMFPATALMYWLGTRSILDLRETLRARDGAAFTLRRFHDDLLGWGSIPVPVVAHLLTDRP